MKDNNNRQKSTNNEDLTNDTTFENCKKIIDLHLENFFNKYFEYPEKVDFIHYKNEIEKNKKEIEEKFIEDENFTEEQKESLRLLMNEKIVELETIKLKESETKKKEKDEKAKEKTIDVNKFSNTCFLIAFGLFLFVLIYGGITGQL